MRLRARVSFWGAAIACALAGGLWLLSVAVNAWMISGKWTVQLADHAVRVVHDPSREWTGTVSGSTGLVWARVWRADSWRGGGWFWPRVVRHDFGLRRRIEVRLPLPLAFAASAAALAGVVGGRMAVRGRRRRGGRCVECGYPLANLSAAKCPECGAGMVSGGCGRDAGSGVG